jgi:hypothetical protein
MSSFQYQLLRYKFKKRGEFYVKTACFVNFINDLVHIEIVKKHT